MSERRWGRTDRDWMSVEEMWDAFPERFYAPGFAPDDVPAGVVEAALT